MPCEAPVTMTVFLPAMLGSNSAEPSENPALCLVGRETRIARSPR
jgi:hypothetical protein